MKLADINQISDASLSEVCSRIVFLESLLDDLLTGGGTKIQSVAERKPSDVWKRPEIKSIVASAKKLNVSLLSAAPQAIKWWSALFDALNVGAEHRTDLLKRMVAEIRPQIDVTRENEAARGNLEARRLLAQKGLNRREIDRIMRVIGAQRGPLNQVADLPESQQIKYALAHIHTLEEAITEASKSQKAIEMLAKGAVALGDRSKIGPKLIRSANNSRIATLAINIIINWIQEQPAMDAEILPEPPVVKEKQKQQAIDRTRTLWKMIKQQMAATQRGETSSLSDNEIKNIVDSVRKLGYRIIWQGATDKYPYGTHAPKIQSIWKTKA